MIDIRAIVRDTDLYNLHSHTQFCDGHASMALFADAVAGAGFKHWGFTPHSPVPIESPCNMLRTDVPLFLDEVARLRELYSGRVSFYAGMEIDYLGKDWGPSHAYFQELPLDYRIGSVHFIPSQDGVPVDIDGSADNFMRKMSLYFHDDINYVVNRFFDSSLEMVDAGGFDIIGHFDKVCHNASHYKPGIEEEPWLQARVDELADAIVAKGVIVEVNTKARAMHGRFFPDQRCWKRIKDSGGTIVVNSDAHRLELINASRDEAIGLLRRL